MITVVDFQMGNLGSIANMIAKVGGRAQVSRDMETLRGAEKLILPGVGHFDRGMQNLRAHGLLPVLNERRAAGVPILGICLGMQLMCRRSDEGVERGLGWIDAEVKRFDTSTSPGMKIPHMGWNLSRPVKESPLFASSGDDEVPRFYFVHSFYVDCAEPSDVLTTTRYGADFCSAFERGNIRGVQFHPEKSHAFGMALFRNFLTI